MKPQDDTSGYVYSDIPWRYTGQGGTFFGLDPLVLLCIPLALLALRMESGIWVYLLIAGLAGLFVYASAKGYPSLRVFLSSRYLLYVRRAEWKTR